MNIGYSPYSETCVHFGKKLKLIYLLLTIAPERIIYKYINQLSRQTGT